MSELAPALITRLESMQAWSQERRARRLRLGFVPTLGDLHEGHLSLMRLALERCDRLVVSIFVNPTQFGPGEDYERYPRRLDSDMEKLRALGAALCFAPAVEEIYPPGDSTRVRVLWGADKLCGRERPGHFEGVCDVVARLFNAVQPHEAYFGQKDAQQALILRHMTEDLRFPIRLRLGPTLREEDGLALSSRNAYLSPAERRRAPALNAALAAVGEELAAGERDPARLVQRGAERLRAAEIELEYFALVDPETLETPGRIGPGTILAACAARLGAARLIDNHVYSITEDGIRETLLF